MFLEKFEELESNVELFMKKMGKFLVLVEEIVEGFFVDEFWKLKCEEDLYCEIELMFIEKVKCLFDDEKDRKIWVVVIKKFVE